VERQAGNTGSCWLTEYASIKSFQQRLKGDAGVSRLAAAAAAAAAAGAAAAVTFAFRQALLRSQICNTSAMVPGAPPCFCISTSAQHCFRKVNRQSNMHGTTLLQMRSCYARGLYRPALAFLQLVPVAA
jgi:hypothetical protein